MCSSFATRLIPFFGQQKAGDSRTFEKSDSALESFARLLSHANTSGVALLLSARLLLFYGLLLIVPPGSFCASFSSYLVSLLSLKKWEAHFFKTLRPVPHAFSLTNAFLTRCLPHSGMRFFWFAASFFLFFEHFELHHGCRLISVCTAVFAHFVFFFFLLFQVCRRKGPKVSQFSTPLTTRPSLLFLLRNPPVFSFPLPPSSCEPFPFKRRPKFALFFESLLRPDA